MDNFNQIVEHTKDLRSQHGERNRMMDAMEAMYLMTWGDEEQVKQVMQGVKVTKSPDARNALIGALRLLVATDPVYKVETEENSPYVETVADKIEKAAAMMARRSGRMRGSPLHYDVVLSMLLYGEAHIAITKSADLVEQAKGASPAARAQAEEAAKASPYLFDVWDPRAGFPEWNGYGGLSGYYREAKIMAGEVLDTYGDDGRRAVGDVGRFEWFTICHWWDYENHVVWLDGQEGPIREEKHGLPFVPVVAQIGEGGRLFSKPEQQRQPFLYALWKSGLWERMNLSYTVLYTMIFGFGANPMYYERTNIPGKHLDIDFSVPGGRVSLMQGEDFGPLAKAPVDPVLLQGLDIAKAKTDESTIYGAALGQPMGGSVAYSTVALLNQAGRLPLVSPQRKSGWALADAARLALKWTKLDGVDWGGLLAEEIPEQFEIECDLDIDLPQDAVGNANVANMLAGGENPTVSVGWVRRNILNIQNSDEMTKEVWNERTAAVMYQQMVQDQMRVMQERQAQAAQQAGGGNPNLGSGPGGAGGVSMPGSGPGGAAQMMNQAGPVQDVAPVQPMPGADVGRMAGMGGGG